MSLSTFREFVSAPIREYVDFLTFYLSDDLSDTLNINVVGVQNVMVAFLPLLQKGTGKKVANM